MSSFFIPSGKKVLGSANLQSASVVNIKVENDLTESAEYDNLTANNITATNITTELINGIEPESHSHRHTFDGPDPLPVAETEDLSPIGEVASAGISNKIPRADHTHEHGNLSGGSLHSVATTSTNGFMSFTDKLNLDYLMVKDYLILEGGGSQTIPSNRRTTLTTYFTQILEVSGTSITHNLITGVITVHTSGLYLLNYNISCAKNETGYLSTIVKINEVVDHLSWAGLENGTFIVTSIFSLTAGDTMQIQLVQNSGVPMGTNHQKVRTSIVKLK